MQFDAIVPTAVDRLIQQALHQVLMPLFDPGFSEASYGFRPGRSAHVSMGSELSPNVGFQFSLVRSSPTADDDFAAASIG